MAEIENLKIGNGGTLHIVGNEDIVANAWQAGKTYVKNKSYVIREHRLYVCNVTHTSVEPFDTTKWTEITVGEAINNALDMTDTASGAIATFESEYALPLRNLEIEINAVQSGSGTPSPDNVRPITGFTGANVVNCSDNLVTGMTTSTADGITTSYDNTTGLISIENNSRTTNYATGSSRNAVASNLDTSHTYKYKFIPEITGVIATDAAGVGLPLNEEFTGVASVKLRVTSAYDFVSTHPIGDITTTRLVIVDVTEGGKITTYSVSWQSEAGTVYGGSLDVTTGELTITHYYWTDDGTKNWNKNPDGSFFCHMGTPSAVQEATGACNYAPYVIAFNGLSVFARSNGLMSLGRGWGDIYADVTALKSAFAITPLQVVYPLATPITVQLTPTQINAIVGTNNVFTDTNGDTTLEYYTKRGEQTVRIAEEVNAYKSGDTITLSNYFAPCVYDANRLRAIINLPKAVRNCSFSCSYLEVYINSTDSVQTNNITNTEVQTRTPNQLRVQFTGNFTNVSNNNAGIAVISGTITFT